MSDDLNNDTAGTDVNDTDPAVGDASGDTGSSALVPTPFGGGVDAPEPLPVDGDGHHHHHHGGDPLYPPADPPEGTFQP